MSAITAAGLTGAQKCAILVLLLEEAQAAGHIHQGLPPIAILYTVYARACDPVLEFLKLGGQHDDAQIIDMVMTTCFDGLAAR